MLIQRLSLKRWGMLPHFYGFTEDEVRTLFNRFEVKEELRKKRKIMGI
jgi:hypothetical protein